MQSSNRIFLISLVICTVSLWTKSCYAATSTPLNHNETSLPEDDESSKERHRRLIPQTTFYVANNYVNPKLYRSRVIGPPIQRRFQYTGSRIVGNAANNNNLNNNNNNNNNKYGNAQYYVNPALNDEKFIPSVQYDPKDMDNEEYFIPVRYETKFNYDDYQAAIYPRYQTQRPVLTQATTVGSNNLRGEQQRLRFTTVRPTTTINYNPGYAEEVLISKQNQDFIQRPGFSTEEFEPARVARPQIPQGFRLSNNAQADNRQRKPNVNLNHIVKSLQLTNRLPEMLNADNIDDSIKILVEILSILNNGRKYEESLTGQHNLTPSHKDFGGYKISQSRPVIESEKPYRGNSRPVVIIRDEFQTPETPSLNNGPYHVNIIDVGLSERLNPEIQSVEKPELIETTTPSISYKINGLKNQKIPEDETLSTTEEPAFNYPPPDGVLSHTQNFPPTSVKYGATRGKPNVDYPAYATIPKTDFSCTTQRYKGFFGDPATGCQVWHYCDLNGGKASFLCPNGTIFSQVALTCDWWFNVKCESTTQLYVLNERLYKYILPVMPKFPEDFTGPEVDRYLELKFKEMETKLKEKKQRKHQEQLNKLKNSTPRAETENSDK